MQYVLTGKLLCNYSVYIYTKIDMQREVDLTKEHYIA